MEEGVENPLGFLWIEFVAQSTKVLSSKSQLKSIKDQKKKPLSFILTLKFIVS